jgi:hypothetical protein
MNDDHAQTLGKRPIVASLDRAFARLHLKLCRLIEQTTAETLYVVPQSSLQPFPSIGECVLRSAGVIEQTFGGITANLWDDPFEWTLPEYLSTSEKLLGYLAEVEATRARAFASFTDDACLLQLIATPSSTRALVELLLETLTRATSYQGQAETLVNILSGIPTGGFII